MRLLNEDETEHQIDYILSNNKLPLESLLKPLVWSSASAQQRLDKESFVEMLEKIYDEPDLKLAVAYILNGLKEG